jgi:hypothetical protein
MKLQAWPTDIGKGGRAVISSVSGERGSVLRIQVEKPLDELCLSFDVRITTNKNLAGDGTASDLVSE